jgi:hypothetical protein
VPNSRGTLLRRDHYNRYSWKPAITATGLSGDTTFRFAAHFCQHRPRRGSAYLRGLPVAGHKSITTTVDLYGHLVPEASTCARDALDKAFGI